MYFAQLNANWKYDFRNVNKILSLKKTHVRKNFVYGLKFDAFWDMCLIQRRQYVLIPNVIIPFSIVF